MLFTKQAGNSAIGLLGTFQCVSSVSKRLVTVDDSCSRMQAVIVFPARQAAVQLVPQGNVQKAPLLKILVTVDKFATTCRQ